MGFNFQRDGGEAEKGESSLQTVVWCRLVVYQAENSINLQSYGKLTSRDLNVCSENGLMTLLPYVYTRKTVKLQRKVLFS